MVAITHSTVRPLRTRRAPSAATYRRRRLVAAVLLVLLLLSLVNIAASLVGRDAGELDSARRVVELSVLVEPGDTVWSIAEALARGGDVRPVVDAIVEANGGADLVPGDRLVVAVP